MRETIIILAKFLAVICAIGIVISGLLFVWTDDMFYVKLMTSCGILFIAFFATYINLEW